MDNKRGALYSRLTTKCLSSEKHTTNVNWNGRNKRKYMSFNKLRPLARAVLLRETAGFS
jgi:hypothetical protein